MCGVLGIIGHPKASSVFSTFLMSLQHRGQDACGVAGFTNKTYSRLKIIKGFGKVASMFLNNNICDLWDDILIGHTRYSTRNGSDLYNEIHPHEARSLHGKLAIVSNGDLINTHELSQYISSLKVKMYTENDAEYIASLINIEIRKNGRRIINSIKETMSRIKGGYACLLLMEDDNRLFAFRDPTGIRPLYIAEFTIIDKKCIVFSSETCTFDIIKRYNEAKYGKNNITLTYREVLPGEIIAAHQDGTLDRDYFLPNNILNAGCIFETIYFSRPDSCQFNHTFQVLRERMGEELFKESPVDADIVTSVPKGGIPSAVGYAKASKIPYAITILEEPTIDGARSFITCDEKRQVLASIKYNILNDTILNKKIILIDDSIVRGTTTKILVTEFFNRGAKEVHLRIPCPCYKNSCNYGIETKDSSALISYQRNIDDICKQLGATSLKYLSIHGLYKAIGQNKKIFCDECFTGVKPFN